MDLKDRQIDIQIKDDLQTIYSKKLLLANHLIFIENLPKYLKSFAIRMCTQILENISFNAPNINAKRVIPS